MKRTTFLASAADVSRVRSPCTQDVYAGVVVGQKKFADADVCGDAPARAATAAMASQKIADRQGYTPKTWH